jgi:PAS domain S-box-containing protein
MPSRNPRYTPPRAIELTCKEAYPASMRGTNPKRNSSSASESSSTLSIVIGNQNNYVEVSDGFCKLLGYSRVDLLQMKLEDLAAPGTADITTSFNPSKATGCDHGLWLLVSREGTRILVRYESRLRSDDLLMQSQLEVIGAGY